jgi:hypothetical protein
MPLKTRRVQWLAQRKFEAIARRGRGQSLDDGQSFSKMGDRFL